ncbi:DUF4167 domain-containing protein [Paracoccus zhejiangensis]|uniref:DUF4167 domain-containing protein n=1 Tax=Paracoccus zhejiangensis TaxID=1077935 RepID=A0A2H5EUN7_9RHOB|nr:DUF4167 domain-containing protein [Paracoccus zhejiangensis]AUH63001.1 DUF4167 domain-containing protein [Paracoccus zhejiangensis]
MRSSKSRSRNKSNRQRTLGNVVNRVFDSSGPEGKVRGTPQQIIEKYLTLARDAQLSNDRVAEQSFLQHAEHYTRMLGEAQREQAERQAQNPQGQPHQRQYGDDERDNGNNNGRGGNQQPYGGGYRNDQQPRNDRADDGDEGETRPSNFQPREPQHQQPRAPRDEQQHQQRAPREDAPQHQPRAPRPSRDEAPQPQLQLQPEALPDAMSASDEADSGLVETPESQPKPKRPRAPRKPAVVAEAGEAPAGEAKAPRASRGRRKAEPKDEAAPANTGETDPAA